MSGSSTMSSQSTQGQGTKGQGTKSHSPAGGSGGRKHRKGRGAAPADRVKVGGKDANRVVRSALAQERRRRRIILVSALAGTFVLIAGLIGFGIYQTQKPKKYYTPANATSDSTGIVAGGTGKVHVDMYVDYQCPVCKAFETTAATPLDQMIAKNQITLIFHPVAFLDRMSTTMYSTRAAASAACAADMNQFLPYTKALYAKQPAEKTAGLTDDQLVQIAGQVGIIDPRFAMCVRGQKYKAWVAHVTDAAGGRHVVGTPTVEVDGTPISATGTAPTLAELTTAVNNALVNPPKK